MKKLEVNNLQISIKNNVILDKLNLVVNKGETVLILGPNGHGKSTFLKSILNHYDTKITDGKIFIDDECVNDLTTDQIAKKGLYLASQYPVEIPGLTMLELLRNEMQKADEKVSIIQLYKMINEKIKHLNLREDLLSRSVNENFSGGERKKSEILQMQVINPDFILLDEIDSGLDVDAVSQIADVLKQQKEDGKAIIYISHNQTLLSTLVPDKVVVIMNGTIVSVGQKQLADEINSLGYEAYAKKMKISLQNNDNKPIDLKETNKNYYCNGK